MYPRVGDCRPRHTPAPSRALPRPPAPGPRPPAPGPRPASAATPTDAVGLPFMTVPPTVQSSRFFIDPGSEPAYSGVQISTASACSIALRNVATSGGSGSRSSSGSKCGNRASPRYSTVVTPGTSVAATARTSAVFVDRARVDPLMSRTVNAPITAGTAVDTGFFRTRRQPDMAATRARVAPAADSVAVGPSATMLASRAAISANDRVTV